MDAILSRIPDSADISDWAYRHRGKIAGLATGTLGMWVFTTFMVVVLTGVPFGGERIDPDRQVVYPVY